MRDPRRSPRPRLFTAGGAATRRRYPPGGATYGSWTTPITSALVVKAAAGLGGVSIEGDTVTWSEQRPEEEGRTQLVQRSAGGTVERLPPGVQRPHRGARVRRRRLVDRGGTVWFSHWDDQRLYRQEGDAPPEPVSPEPEAPRATAGRTAS